MHLRPGVLWLVGLGVFYALLVKYKCATLHDFLVGDIR